MVRSLVVGAGAGTFAQGFVGEEAAARGMEPFAPLPSVAGAVEEVARALRAAGIEAGAPVLDPDRDELLAAWRSALDQAAGQPLVVHFSGHGEQAQGTLYLAVSGSERGWRLRETSVDVDALLKDAEARQLPVLFLLDVCEAGQAVTGQLVRDLVLTASERQPVARHAWVIGACAAGETTRQARFSRATAASLRRLADGRLDVSPALAYVPVGTFAAEVARELARDGGLGQSVVHTTSELALAETPGFLPNPAYARDAPGRFLADVDSALRQLALATDPALDLLHFATRAAGNPQADVCQFSGRTAHLARTQTWLDDTDGWQERLLVVTGGPGTGKSALLGVTTCLLHPDLRPLRRRVRARVTGYDPQPRARVLAVHARQLTVQQITDSLLRQLPAPARPARFAEPARPGHGADDGPQDSEQGGTERLERLAARIRATGPVVIILDALDEAADPAAVVRDLILPLTDTTTHDRVPVPGCRVMVGTRPWWETLHQLQEHVLTRPGSLLALDPATADDRRILADDLASYLGLLLDRHYPEAAARVIADSLAQHAETGAFLVAALYADHLLQQARAGGALSDEQIRTSLPHRITEVFDLHTDDLAASDPWVGAVLHVLGQARGQGMPIELIHQAALAHTHGDDDNHGDDDAGLRRSLEDTHEALRKAAFYLRTTPDSDHRLLYRYFHQTLTDHTSSLSDPTAVHHGLIRAVPTTPAGTPDWELAHPYLKRHAADHAVAAGGGALDRLLEDPSFLLHADPDTLAPHLHHAVTRTAVEHAHIYRTTTAHHPSRHQITARRDLLALDAAAWQKPGLARTLATTPLGRHPAPAVPLRATTRNAHPDRLRTFTGHTGAVEAAGAVVLPDGRALAVTADRNSRVLVWDLATGRHLHTLAGSGMWVRALATVVLPDGRALAVTGDQAGTVLVWDLVTGRHLRTLTGHTSVVYAVAAVVLPDGRALAVTGDHAGTVLVWDLVTGRHLRTLTGHTSVVEAAGAVVLPDGRALAVTGDHAGMVLVWDLATGRHLDSFTSPTMWVHAVAAVVLPDGRALAVAADHAGTVLVWDLVTGRHLRTLTGHSSEAYAVAAVVLPDGQALAVTTDRDGKAVVWDLTTGRHLRTLTGHSSEAYAVVTVVLPDGQALAVTTDRDGKAVVWDLTTGRRPPTLTSPTSEVYTVSTAILPDGRSLAVAGDREGTTVVWDLTAGRHPRILTSPTSQVFDAMPSFVPIGHEYAATIVVLPDGRALAVTADDVGRALVWNVVTGRHLHTLTGHTTAVRSVATAVLRDGQALAVTADYDGKALVWNVATGKYLRTLTDLTRPAYAVATVVLPDGQALALTTDRDGKVLVRDVATGHHLRTLSGHTHRVYSMATAVMPDGRAFAVTADNVGKALVWDVVTGHHLHTLAGHAHSAYAVAAVVLPEGQALAITADRTRGAVLVWDLVTGHRIGTSITLPNRVHAISATEEGIVAGHGPELAYLIWNLPETLSSFRA